MQGEHSDAREARDVPGLLSPPPAAVTEGLSIVRLFCRSSLFLHAHNPSDLASLAHLPLHRRGYKVCLHIEKGRSEERPFSMLDMRLTYAFLALACADRVLMDMTARTTRARCSR